MNIATGRMTTDIQAYVDDMEAKGETPDMAELNKFTADMILKGRVVGGGKWFGDRDVRKGEVLGTSEAKNFQLDVSKENHKDISIATGIPEIVLPDVIQVLVKSGKPLTASWLRFAYDKGKRKGK